VWDPREEPTRELWSRPMLNGRLYRVAFVPFLIALAIAAFSLGSRPAPLTSTLAPDAFEGQQAFAELRSLAAAYPNRGPGSAGDERLAAHIAKTLKGLGGTAGGGFSVRTENLDGETIDGKRSLSTVIAQRPGSTTETPLLIVAHRDAAAGGSEAELSGTAALLELARVFAARETRRTIVLASTSGGSGGAAGAAALTSQLHGPFDAAIVLGDLAGKRTRRPFVVPYSDGFGSAPLELQSTVADAMSTQANYEPGASSALGQLAHLAFPFATGEQGVLDAQGLPAVLVQVSGELGPSPREPVSAERLEGVGRSVLSALDALDTDPDLPAAMQDSTLLQRKTIPEWAVRLLVGALLLPALIAVADGLARARRRRLPAGRAVLWTLSCALPFFTCAVLAYLLGWLGVLGATPSVPVLPSALPFDGSATTAVVALVLTFALAWLLWGVLVQRLGWGMRPDPEVAGLAMLLVAVPVAILVWLANPYTALLALPALHLWLMLASRERLEIAPRLRRLGSLALVALGLLPLALLILFYARQYGMGVGEVAWAATLLVAGGHVGFLAVLLWSVALGSAAAAVAIALAAEPAEPVVGPRSGQRRNVTIRGPLSYAGPGSLGGTESALRR
jgi:hypothetical protein